MTASIISGTEIAKQTRDSLANEVTALKQKGVHPGLVIILVGDNPASLSYIKGKKKASEEIGIRFKLEQFPESLTEEELLDVIGQYNEDQNYHGILVQLPLPNHIDEIAVIEKISPEKDVDGFHPVNLGKMLTGQKCFLSCTPAGIMEMLRIKGITPAGKHAVVVGRSNIVGKPVGQLLLKENATVSYCHSRTENLSDMTRQADILVVAAGRANLITGNDIKPGAVVIDVGMNRNEQGKLCGDVAFEEAKEVASYITPVPGGVGPMTITMLAHNTVEAAKNTLL
ncbi:bifunctional methylenetetrahydrofolate dehydrogenase/methenyltetrahydrofolate cyclohydrolase FolD [Bacillus sp. FJAT-42376]|uniref:bifunctional methylenetetrahydrofolate dehydrogenase/methenyltetrahydrofolate cyclohydrolase FolD n=1 Tax=Bacillus sp. FJAT-42376 TaxID=2014076 RepID=UPI000F4FE4C6|nr:bifunctional methylenetetrahydrofolate dehydrogenase/methenyltetrahydrofolate cyclohydrolase FolD [Bacillus sp. FJAT-42376]AZB43529.1 bifunctional methylenetetrahydrofolate dehydrogenase/methenyltetrahydrofolate cyclohydrolase FolD [Bacillus sp. FJAT-42376]